MSLSIKTKKSFPSRVLGQFDDKLATALGVMAERGHPGSVTDRVAAAAREHMATILPLLDEPGTDAPYLTPITVLAAIDIAFYLGMRGEGQDIAEAGAVCEAATRRTMHAPGPIRWIITRVFFSRWNRSRLARAAAKTQRAPIQGWVYTYVDGDGESSDFGLNCTRCGAVELASRAGAPEFAPYLCLGDTLLGDFLGWGIRRSETLAHGGKHCDFSFKRGGLTQITVPGWLRRKSAVEPEPEPEPEAES